MTYKFLDAKSARMIGACFVFGLLTAGLALDWRQYRGPFGDGSTSETIRVNWNEQPPSIVWRQTIGPGFSSMAVGGGRLVTQEKRSVQGEDREFCVCLDAETGEEIWSVDVDQARYDDLVGYNEGMDGPRSTPSMDDAHAYVLTSYMKLYCLALEDGSVAWSRDLRAELNSSIPSWQNAASPLLVGDLIYLNVSTGSRSLMAIRKSDGTIAWRGQDDGVTHSTPVFANIGGVDQVVFLTRSGLVALTPDDGEALWRHSFSPSTTSTAASPLVAGEYIHASAAYAAGTWVARVRREADGFVVTGLYRERSPGYQLHWSSPVHRAGFLYGIPSANSSQARLACLELETGENRWEQTTVGSGNIGFGSIIQAANALIVLTESGELVLVEPDPETYRELARYQILDRFCWNNPVLSDGRIYARNTSASQAPEIVAVDVSPESAPLPAFLLEASRIEEDTGLTIVLRRLDGQEFDARDAGRFEVIASPNVASPLTQWTVVETSFEPGESGIKASVSFDGAAARFMLVRERGDAN